MANPFLFMEEESSADTASDAFSNPFLVEDDGEDDGSSDNPFFSQANNPFADFGGAADEIMAAITTTASFMDNSDTLTQTGASLFLADDDIEDPAEDAAMSFFGTTINESDGLTFPKPHELTILNIQNTLLDDVVNYSSEEELKKKVPPRPNPPPSHATQQLITSLADQMDQTSSNLLNRLPVTRTPSPVNMRDLHSPSPTPDSLGDLLDVSDSSRQHQPQQESQNNFFDMGQNDFVSEAAQPMEVQTDNPFGLETVVQQEAPKMPPSSLPNRPPPPRPTPPRPTPPKGSVISSPVSAPTPIIPTETITQVQAGNDQDQDLFNFFGTTPQKKPPPKPPAPKSKEDILSLFSVTKAAVQAAPVQQPDLLSGDIMDMDIGMANGVSPPSSYQEQTIPQQIEDEPMVQETAAPQIQAAEPVYEFQEMQQEVVPEIQEVPQIEETIEQTNDYEQEESVPRCPSTQPIPTIEMHLQPEGISQEFYADQSMPNSESNSPVEKPVAGFFDIKPSPLAASIFEEHSSVPDYEEPISTVPDFGAPAEEEASNPFDFTGGEPPIVESQTASAFMDQYFSQPEPIVEPEPIFAVAPAPAPIRIKPAPPPPPVRHTPKIPEIKQSDDFDEFAAKFESKTQPKTGNAFLDSLGGDDTFGSVVPAADAWGDSGTDAFGITADDGFGNEDETFDSFLASHPPAPEKSQSVDSDEGKEGGFNVFIRPRDGETPFGSTTPALAPPPQKSPYSGSVYSNDSSERVNPFDKSYTEGGVEQPFGDQNAERRESQDSSPPTPLFDDDVSQPLEDFPRITYHGDGWEMQLRQPNKKKITGQRFWKKVWVRLVFQGDNPVVQLLSNKTDKEPFQELPLQGCYSVSEIGAQQFDNFGKNFTIKLQYVFYKERPGVRPGQVTKAERLTNKLSQFAAFAIQGDYQGCKEFGSDLKKLGLPVEHAPQVSQLFKVGSMNYEDMKQMSMCIEEALFKLNVHRDRALTYKMEEVQLTAVDEIYVEQTYEGIILKQIARVRLFFLGFLSGMPSIELGMNDLWRQGKEVVGRHDIIPVVTEEWIRLEGVEFHACVQQDEYERTRTIKFKPPDACYIELMRFRVRPPKNRELPLQLKATWIVTGNKVRLQADVLVPGFASRKLGQIPCEDVSIRFPIPECWIYLFRVEKHFRYGSVKSTHRRTGKIKGIERFLGTVETLQESLIEVTSGQAKYEHHHRAIVWRCPRLPKEGQGAYTTHQLVCRLALTSFDQIPEKLAPFAFVEFTMPATQVSHTTVRSVSVQESDSDEPPEKYVRYLARHEYQVGIEHTTEESQNAYLAATARTPKREEPIREEQPMATTPVAPSDTDSDSN